MKVIQLLPVLRMGDAIGNETLAIRDILLARGIQTEIYAEGIDSRLPRGIARPVEELGGLREEDVLLYHASTGFRLSFDLPTYGGRLVMIYHNVTPPHFFSIYSKTAERIAAYGEKGIAFLANKTQYCIAISAYNAEQLRNMGYTCPIDVCPIIIPFDEYEQEPEQDVLERYAEEGWTNWLFVGRIAPNKRQEDIIRAFYIYQKETHAKSRLFLVGNSFSMERYEKRLRLYVKELGLENLVIFPGHISFSELLAYYRLADVFVCMSEHEGFCVPLLEAMYFGKPIVAFGATAVPETVGKAGLLTEQKDPQLVAAMVQRVLTDENLGLFLANERRKQLEKFSYQRTCERFNACLDRILTAKSDEKM